MIKLERTSVMNFENAIRGARNPMNSWDRGDSYSTISYEDGLEYEDCLPRFVMGENDLALAKRLIGAGSDHRKFLRQIFVSVDITAPLYWWKEFDTYKVGTVANSCSTMHKIHSKPFERSDFSCDRLDEKSLEVLDYIVAFLEEKRQEFISDTSNRQPWHDMIQLLPSSYNQMRTVTLNYENLISMYYARRNHKLAEWHTLCDWIENLPYFKEMCLGGEVNEE